MDLHIKHGIKKLLINRQCYNINFNIVFLIFNKGINKTRIIVDMIDRFIIRGL